MRFLLLILSLPLAGILNGGPVAAQSGQYHGRTPLGPDFDILTVRNSDGDDLHIHSRVDEVDGVYVICMATSGRENEDNVELLQYQQILLNGQVILRGTDWAPHYFNPNGRQAVCQKTRARIVPDPVFTTEWARHDF